MAYIDKYGVEFSDDRKTLVRCPMDFQGEYIIPDGVTSIDNYVIQGRIVNGFHLLSHNHGAFQGCTGLTSIVIPDSVTRIGDSAFSQCTGLTSIVIPDSVTSIGDNAFYLCRGLTSVTIPNSVTNIGERAFYGCDKLTTIVLSDNLTSIERYVFQNCTSLTSIVIPDSVTRISESAFEGCSSLTYVKIPNAIASIANIAFGGCTQLTSIAIPISMEFLGDHVFFNCSNLTTIIWQARNCHITSISISERKEDEDCRPFEGCLSLKEFIFGDSVEEIPSVLCRGLCNIDSIKIPNKVRNIGWNAFTGCVGIKSVTWSASQFFYKDGNSDSPFNECLNIRDFVFDDSITEIPAYICKGLVGLTSIVIPDSVTSIGNSAFDGCTGLTSIEIPDNVTSIGNYAFHGCTGLTSIVIPDSVTSIGNCAFKDCRSLTSIKLPNSITEINGGTFYGCCSLKTIAIPDSVTSINGYYNDGAFAGCSGLTSVVIPDSVTSIGDMAFRDCTGLTYIKIPDKVTKIGESVFDGCTGLTSIVIPKNVASIGVGAFGNCTKMSSIIVEDENEKYDSRFNCNAIIDVTSKTIISACATTIIPDDVHTIGEKAFMGCTELLSITIPNNITRIQDGAFIDCIKLVSICIPEYVDFIGKRAFENCSNLKYVRWKAQNCGIGVNNVSPFTSCTNICSFEFGESVDKIASYLCKGLNSLKSIVIPRNVTYIGNEAFAGCYGVTDISVAIENQKFDSRNNCNAIIETDSKTLIVGCQNTIIPDDITNIGYKAFSGCSSLYSISIPQGIHYIDLKAFEKCINLRSIQLDYSLESIKVIDSLFNQLLIKDVFGQQVETCILAKGITHIDDYLFSNCSCLTQVILPEGVISIGKNVFENCKKLTAINIPDSLEKIDRDAFKGCESLYKVSIHDLKSFCQISFHDYSSNPLYYAKHLFLMEREVTNIIIPNGVKNICDYAFNNCRYLTSVKFSDSVTRIGMNSFQGCTGLTSIVIPDSVTSIGNYAFQGCTGLTSIVIPDSVTRIGDSAFWRCNNISSITIPKHIEYIGSGSFYDCPKLKKVIIESPIVKGNFLRKNMISGGFCDYHFVNIFGPQVTTYILCDNISEIDAYAFRNCTNLTSIVIPDSVTTIGRMAFLDCSSLTSVTIPNSVISIGEQIFEDCDSLKEICIPKGQKTRFLKIGLQKYADLIVEHDNEEISTLTTVAKAYELGIGLPQNFTQAVLIYTQAAEKGGAEAAYKLAELYAQGEKLPYDRDKALAYYRQAAKSAFKDAASKVEGIQQQIKAEEARKAAALEAEKRRLLEEQKRKEEQHRKEQEEQLRKEQEERQRKEQEEQKRKELEERWRLEELREHAYYIFFDTETAGLPKRYRGFDVENWPRLVQLAWILTDKEGNIVNQKVAIIRPDGFTIPSDAAAIHGITTEVALREGEPIKVVLDEFIQDLKDAHWLVGHNIDFDKHIIGAEFDRLGIVNGKLRLGPSTCTMRASTDYCAIPDPNGQYKYRWPKLQELYQKLFGYKFDSAHDAMADVTATKDCFFELMRRGIINTRY